MKTPVFCSPAIPASSGTQYSTCHDYSYDTARKGWVGTEPYGTIVQCAGNVFVLRLKVTNAPGSGKSWTVTLRVNGVDSSLSLTLADTATTASATGSVAIAVGDRLTLKCVPSGTPAAPGRFATSLGFESTASGESFFSAYTEIDFNGGGSAPLNGTGSAGYQIIPCAGVLSNFIGRVDSALGSGESFVMSINVNGSTTALTFTCDQTHQSREDTTHQVTVAAGDRVYIEGVHYSGSVMIGISLGCKFVPDVPGQSAILGYFIVDSGSAGEYLPVGNGTWKDHEGEAGAKNLVPFDVSWQAVYMQTDIAAGSGGTYSLTARLNGSSQSLVATVSGSSQKDANDLSHATALSAGDDIDFVTGTSGGGFVNNIRHGSVFYLAENVLRINGSANIGAVQTGSGGYSFNVTIPDAHSSVIVFIEDNGSSDPSVTLDGSAMTKVTAACQNVGGSSPHRVSVWKTIDKAAGTYAVAVTPDGSVSRSWAVAYSWGGNGTDAPVVDTSGGNSGTGLTSISTTLSPAAGSIGIDMLGMSSAISFSEDSPQERLDTSGVNFLAAATSKQPLSSNATMGWSCSPSHDLVQSVVWMKEGGGASGAISGAAAGSGAATGALSGSGALAGAAAGSGASTGGLGGAGALAGAATGSAAVTGALDTPGIAGAATGSGAATGTLTGNGALAGAATGAASGTGSMAGDGPISGAVTATATVAGTLTGSGLLLGAAGGIATVTGVLSTPGQISGAATGAGAATGVLVGAGALAGAATGSANLTGFLTDASGGTTNLTVGSSFEKASMGKSSFERSSFPNSGSSMGFRAVAGWLERKLETRGGFRLLLSCTLTWVTTSLRTEPFRELTCPTTATGTQR